MEPLPLRFRTFILSAQNTLLLFLTPPACHLGSMSPPREACPHSSSRGRVPVLRDGLTAPPRSPTCGRAPPPPGHVGNSRRAGRASSCLLGAQRGARRPAGTEEASAEGRCPERCSPSLKLCPSLPPPAPCVPRGPSAASAAGGGCGSG